MDTLSESEKNKMEYKQNLILESMTLAWSSPGCIETIQKKNDMEYEQNLILGSMTLAWSSLECIETIQKRKQQHGIRTKSDLGIHDFGLDHPWMQ